MIHTAFGHLDLALQVPMASLGSAPSRNERTGTTPSGREATERAREAAGGTRWTPPGPKRDASARAARTETTGEGEPCSQQSAGAHTSADAQALREALPSRPPAPKASALPEREPATGVESSGGVAILAGAALQPIQGAPLVPPPAMPQNLPAPGTEPALRLQQVAVPGAGGSRGEALHRFEPQRLTAYRSTVRPTPEIPAATGEAILKRIALFLDKDGGEAILDLNPPGLGRLAVKLVLEGRQVTLQIQTTGDAAARFLEQNLEPLRQALASQGLQVNEISVRGQQGGEEPARFARQAERQARAARPREMYAEEPGEGSADPVGMGLSIGGIGSALDLFA